MKKKLSNLFTTKQSIRTEIAMTLDLTELWFFGHEIEILKIGCLPVCPVLRT